MQGHECNKGDELVRDGIMESLVRVDGEWVWDGEGQAGSGTQSSEKQIKGLKLEWRIEK